jgi:hypothetical protein
MNRGEGSALRRRSRDSTRRAKRPNPDLDDPRQSSVPGLRDRDDDAIAFTARSFLISRLIRLVPGGLAGARRRGAGRMVHLHHQTVELARGHRWTAIGVTRLARRGYATETSSRTAKS